MRPTRVYVASSWKNEVQPSIVEFVRNVGGEAYDFKNPGPEHQGFHWTEVMPSWDREAGVCDQHEYLEAIDKPRAIEGFGNDMNAMLWADACILVLPSGRSAHLELGWFVGQDKPTAILLDGPLVTPELMYRMVDCIATDLSELKEWFEPVHPESLLDACRLVMNKVKPGQSMDSSEILSTIRRRFGDVFPYCSVIDVADEMRKFYG